jgi:hypothetical protein
MDKQINLIPNPQPPRFSDYRKVKVTAKNELLMKQCFEEGYAMRMVSIETIEKVRATNYVK